jgi:tetratricopeptide (TPR) repeat protein
MASKINLRFLLIFLGVLAAVAMLAGGVYLWQRSSAPTRNFAAGERYEKEGDFRKALSAYGRAVARQQTNAEYLDAMDRVLQQVVPVTVEEARDLYNQWIAVRFQRGRATPSDPAPWIRAMETLYDRNTAFNSDALWREFSTEAERAAERVPIDAPEQNRFKYWRAVGFTRRGATITEAERSQAENWLREVVEKDPKFDAAWTDLIRSQAEAAQRLLTDNRVVDARKRFADLDATIEAARKANPDGAAWRLGRLERLSGQLARKEPGITPEAVDAVRTELLAQEDKAIQSRDGTFQLALALLGGRGLEWQQRVVKLLADRVTAQPRDMLARRVLILAAGEVDRDLADRLAEETIAMPNLPVSLDSLVQDEARTVAITGLFNARFAKFVSEKDPARKQTLIPGIREARDRAVKFLEPLGDRPGIRLIDAKAALAEDRVSDAALAFDEVLRTQPMPSSETYLYAAMTNLSRREPGTAMRICNDGLDRHPGNMPLLLVRAEIETAMGRVEQARRTIADVQLIDPNNPRAKDLLVALGRAPGTMAEAAAEGRDDVVTEVLGQAERRIMAKDFDAAAAMLKAQLEKNPRDLRLYVALAQLYGAGKEDVQEGLAWIDRGLKIDPKDQRLLQLRAMITTRDPVERVLGSLEVQYADQRARDVAIYVTLVELRPSLQQIIESPRSTETVRKETQASLTRLEAMLPARLEAALSAAPRDEILLEAACRDALSRRDWAGVERIAATAEKSGERGMAAVLRSRVLMAQDQPKEAMQVLLAARQAGDQSAALLRQLSLMYEREGNLEAAKEAMQLAYEKRPNDPMTARLYALLLDRTGERSRSLDTLRALARSNPDNRDILHSLLLVEMDIGDRAGALAMRRRLYRDSPGFRENAQALASLLLDAPGEPTFLQDANGNMLFKPEEIRSPSPSVQQKLKQAEQDNIKLGQEILRLLQQQNPTDPNLSIMRARALVRHGSLAEGEKALRDDIAKAPPQLARVLWIGLGALLAENGEPQLAKEPFEKAIALQDPGAHDAEVEIADFWFNQRQWDRARKVLQPVVDTDTDAERKVRLAARLAEICKNLRDFTEAEKYLAMAEKGTPKSTATLQMLRGSIEASRAQEATNSGKLSEALEDMKKAADAMRSAAELTPNNAMAWAALADAERNVYLQTREPARLSAAVAAADQSLSILSTYLPAIRVKKDLLMDQADLAGAISLIERFVRSVPQSGDGRRQWIELLMQEGSTSKAIDVAEEGARLEPRNPQWVSLVGSIHKNAGRKQEAVRAFDRAFAAAPDESTLVQAVNARLEMEKPDWAEIVNLIKNNPKVAGGSVTLQGMLAAALVNNRQRDAGLQALRSLRSTIQDRVAKQGARPDLWDVWFAAVGQAFRGQPKEAEAFVLSTLGGTKPDFYTSRGLARIWRLQGKSGLDAALQRFADALASAGESKDLALQVAMEAGECAYAENDCPRASEWFTRAVEIAPDQPASLNNAAFVVVKCSGDMARGEAWARKATQLAPGVPDFLDTLGYILVRAGKPEEALAPLQQAVSVAPTAQGIMHLAEALSASGRKDEARKVLGRLDPKRLSPELQAERAAIEKSLQ